MNAECSRCRCSARGIHPPGWSTLIDEIDDFPIDVGLVCPNCHTARDRMRLGMLEFLGEHGSLLAFEPDSEAAWGQ